MPAKNLYHDAVVEALIADGWTITDDPLTVLYGGRRLYVDLGVERVSIGAARGEEKIALEVQSFLSPSGVSDLHQAVGQYVVYRTLLEELQTGRPLFLAVTDDVYERLFAESVGQLVVRRNSIRLMVFDPLLRKVIQWTS